MCEARRFYAQIRGAVFEHDLHLPPPQPSLHVQRDIVCTLHSECPSQHVPWVSALCNWAIKEKCVVEVARSPSADLVILASGISFPSPPSEIIIPATHPYGSAAENNEFCMVNPGGEGILVWREKQINFQSEETTTKWINTFVWEVFRRKMVSRCVRIRRE